MVVVKQSPSNFFNLVFDIGGTSNSVRELNWGDVKLGLYIKIVHL